MRCGCKTRPNRTGVVPFQCDYYICRIIGACFKYCVRHVPLCCVYSCYTWVMATSILFQKGDDCGGLSFGSAECRVLLPPVSGRSTIGPWSIYVCVYILHGHISKLAAPESEGEAIHRVVRWMTSTECTEREPSRWLESYSPVYSAWIVKGDAMLGSTHLNRPEGSLNFITKFHCGQPWIGGQYIQTIRDDTISHVVEHLII